MSSLTLVEDRRGTPAGAIRPNQDRIRSRPGLRERRHVRHLRNALRGHGRERLDLARLGHLLREVDRCEVHLRVAAITAVMASGAPLNGTCTMLILASCLKNSAGDDEVLATPAEEKLSWPGFSLASAMKSFSVLAGKSGGTIATSGTATTRDAGEILDRIELACSC